MTTPILNIPELALGQIDQFLTANAAFRTLEAAGNDVLSVSLASGNATLTGTQFAGAVLFLASGNTVARTITVPASKRFFAVHNSGSYPIGVVRGSTTLTVAAGQAQLLYSDGTTNGLISLGGGGQSGLRLITESTTSRTLSITDAEAYIRCTNGGSVQVTVPPVSSEPWQSGQQIHIRHTGAGSCEIVQGSGVTVNTPAGGTLFLAGQGATVTLVYAGSDVWDLMGQVVPA